MFILLNNELKYIKLNVYISLYWYKDLYNTGNNLYPISQHVFLQLWKQTYMQTVRGLITEIIYFSQHSPSSWNVFWCFQLAKKDCKFWESKWLCEHVCSFGMLICEPFCPVWTFSCIRWQRVSTCLVRSWKNMGFEAMGF